MALTVIKPTGVDTSADFVFDKITVSSNVNAASASNVTLGAVGNLHISGGSNGYFLQTDGSGALSWAAASSSGIANGNSNISIPSANGNINLSSAGNTNILVITGTGANVSGTLTASENITGSNIISTSTTASSSKTTGAITTAGGLGVAGTLNAFRANILAPYGNIFLTEYVGIFAQKTSGTVLSQVTTDNLANGIGWSINSGQDPSMYSTGNIYFRTGVTTRDQDTPTGGTTPVTIAATGLYSTGVLSASGNVIGLNGNLGNLVLANYISGTLTTAAQPNITSIGTLTSLGVTGNIIAGNLIGTLANGNSNVRIPSANGNISLSSAGNANVLVVTGTGANVTGTLTTSGVITGNGSGLTSIAGGNISGTVANATYAVTSGTSYSVDGANVSGTVANATYAVTSGTSYSVDGANVSGTVANATNATTSTTQVEKTANTTIATTAFVDRLRSLTTSSTGLAGTLVVGDRGALVAATGGITVPASVFAAQDVVTIVNNSASPITITQGAGLTMYLVGTATTGNRTLAQRGMATVVFISDTVAIISGGGVT